MLDTSGVLFDEQDKIIQHIAIATIDILINAFEVLTLQRIKLINKYKVKLLWEDEYENIFSTTKLSYRQLCG